MLRFLALAVVATAAACAPQAAQPEGRPPVAIKQIPIAAPMPAAATRAVTVDDAGKTVAVTVGSRFAVQLVGVPTAGYLWKPVQVPPFLAPGETAGGPTQAAQLQPGFAGGNHWEVFAFTATAAGAGDLVLEQRRPWEKDQPPAATFRVRIKAD